MGAFRGVVQIKTLVEIIGLEKTRKCGKYNCADLTNWDRNGGLKDNNSNYTSTDTNTSTNSCIKRESQRR